MARYRLMRVQGEGKDRQRQALLREARGKSRINRRNLQHGKFPTEQGIGLDTARGPFTCKSLCDWFFFFLFDRGKMKILADKL